MTHALLQADERSNTHLALTLAVFAAYCLISALGFLVPAMVSVMALAGLLFPLAWGRYTGNWDQMGFTRKQAGKALLWGVGAGIITSLIGYLTVEQPALAENLALELAIGVPMWLLMASPFQEFFFRGWLQTRLEARLGDVWGLLAGTVCFTLWHFCLPIFGGAASTYPVNTPGGIAAIVVVGFVYGYSFQRTGSLLTSWLAHALSGIMFIVVGAASFLTAM